MTSGRARKHTIRNRMIVTNEPFLVAARARDNDTEARELHRRRTIAARCRVTGEPRSLVAHVVGKDGSHGLDACTDAQRRFRAQLALFLLNARTEGWEILTGPVASQRVWAAWAVLDRFLPYPETLVITSNAPDALRQALIGPADQPGYGMPGLRQDPATSPANPAFVHLPTGATLHVQGPATPPVTPAMLRRLDTSDHQGLPALTFHERRLLDHLPPSTGDAEQLLAALLIRLPLADPHRKWILANRHLYQVQGSLTPPAIGPPEVGSQFLWGRESAWRFEWQGPARASDMATALTDPLLGLAGTTALLSKRPLTVPTHPQHGRLVGPAILLAGHSLIIQYGTATLTLHGDL